MSSCAIVLAQQRLYKIYFQKLAQLIHISGNLYNEFKHIIKMKFNPYLEVIVAAIIWSTNGVFIKFLNLPPTTMSFFRLAIPTIILFAYFKFRKIKLFDDKNKLLLFFISFIVGIKTLLFMIGIQLAPLSTVVIVSYSWPIWATLFSVIILKEKIVTRNIFLLLLAFVGIILIFLKQNITFENLVFVGLFLILIMAVLHALMVVLSKRESNKISRYKIVFYQNFMGFFMFLPFIFINPIPSIGQTGVAITYAVFCGLIGYIIFFSALKRINASIASHLSYVEVVSAVLFSIILFKEVLTWNIVVGGLLIIVSTCLLKK